MTLTGYLSDFSLAEVFQLLEQGKRTGLLTVRPISRSDSSASGSYYLWLDRGRIVAAADRLDKKGLLHSIEQHGWLRGEVATAIFQVCKLDQPMGTCLKEQGVIKTEQLVLLFLTQVVQQICTLLALEEGRFSFQDAVRAPVQEMTGLSKPATETMFVGLRALKTWPPALLAKLPEPTSGMTSLVRGTPTLSLNVQEKLMWTYVDGATTLQAIAKQLPIPLETVQKIAFRFSVCGLTEEVPLVATLPVANPSPSGAAESQAELSQSFLDQLTSLLQARAV